MKILHLIPDLNAGGAERLALETCLEQQAQGHSAKIAYFENKVEYPELAEAAVAIHTPSYYVPSIFGKASTNLVSLEKLVWDFKPDIIHSHRYVAEIVRTELNHLPSAGYLTHIHNRMPAFKKPSLSTLFSKKSLTQAWERRRLLKRYSVCDNHFLAISTEMESYFKENLPAFWHQKIHLVPNAVNLDRFLHLKPSYPDGNSFRIISVGRLVQLKGHDYLIRAVAELNSEGLDVQLSIAGEGPEYPRLVALAEELKIHNSIHFLGHREDIPELLEQYHLYVHGAWNEGFGLSIVEALAAGLPVVAADGGGPKDILGVTRCGILVEPKDIGAMKEGIKQALSSKDYWQALATAGRVRAEEYGMVKYVQKLTGLYQEILKEKRG